MLVLGARIEPDDRFAGLHLLHHEVLVGGHLDRFGGDVVGDPGRDDDDAVVVADDDVARKQPIGSLMAIASLVVRLVGLDGRE